jgi:hypothetical protein
MIALYVRLRGKLGRGARVGFRLIAAGLIVGFGSGMLWFPPGYVLGLAMLLTGVSSYLVGALRADVVPRTPLLLWVVAFVGAVVVGFGGMATGLDTGYVAIAIGHGFFNAGWIWLGRHMFAEHPFHDEGHTPALA